MDLSVIIVNYNVKYFLEQCLHSVMMAISKIQAEVIVVDNNSADGSVSMIRQKFPHVILIANTTNTGFARANNQAVKKASGRYILLLNPDTVVQEDSFLKCIQYMDKNPEAGCLGVKMIDGKGKFLPESKRSLPTPPVAFYKVFGLSKLFPRSKTFGRYHLGFLNPDEIHKVDVISGAYMFMRRSALDKTGHLDESFFMYGEDIDLSYRFIKAGFSNIYFPDTTIIHYKGESTKKSSINYVVIFYKAMIIFARKHFKESTARYFAFFIHLAIYFRAGLSILTRFIKGIATPFLDFLLIYSGYYFLLPFWELNHFGQRGYYPKEYMILVVPAYVVIWLISIFMSTGYERKTKFMDLLRGVLTGSVMILLIYALLPESWRFSRALIILGTLWALLCTTLVRLFLSRVSRESFSFEFFRKKKKVIVIGDLQECKRVFAIISQTQSVPDLAGFVSPENGQAGTDFIGHIDQIQDIVQINQVDELVFCAASMPSHEIIRTMLQFTHTGIEFKIAPPESMSVIGSSSNDISGELYVLHFNTLSRILNKRKKRLFDVILSVILVVLSPVLVFLVAEPAGLYRNIFSVLKGAASWVGYYQSTGGNHPGLPKIRPGVLTMHDLHMNSLPGAGSDEQLNLMYAKDYRITNDLRILFNGYKQLGRLPSGMPGTVH
ncbi:MAG: glycosyltransferase [Bacteroidales bacterium]|nr:glycosyltransferase [Bacteroidales bacterium]